ncbi:MAG: GAF domain-containing protein [Gloeobacterales cyanobacterium]
MPQNTHGTFDSTNNLNNGTFRETELIGIIGDNSTSFERKDSTESVSEQSLHSVELGSNPSSESSSADIKGVTEARGNHSGAAEGAQGSEMGVVLFAENLKDKLAPGLTGKIKPVDDMNNMSTFNKLTALNGLFRQALNQEDVLKTVVAETRQFLKADRVIVFRLDEDLSGVITQESVAPGFPETIGRYTEDPCFKDWFAKLYLEGRVAVVNDIYQTDYARCYIEALERVAARAILVAPIIEDERLLGLLIVHQCSRPRAWQQHEIDLFTQIAIQVGVALERASLSEQRKAEVKRAELQANITRLLHKDGLDCDGVLKTSVIETKQALKADRVIVIRLDKDLSGVVTQEAVAPGLPQALHREIEDLYFKEGYVNYYQEGQVTIINDIHKANFAQCYIEAQERVAAKAILAAPIITEQQLYGFLIAHQCSMPREWQQAEIDLFSHIAIQTGVALDRASLLDQRKTEAKRLQLQMSITKMLHQEALNLGNVLKTTVVETRQFLRTDRMMILRFNEDMSGVIAQESVVPGLVRTLDSHIEDPFFVELFTKLYKEGQVFVINNIHETNYAKCYIDALERVGAKAVLAAPIIRDEPLLGPQLYGLLIAHHCSGPRNWSQSEVDLFAQVAIQTGFALERADLLESREAEIEKVSFQTDASQLIQMIRTSTSPEEVLKEAAEEVRQLLKTDQAIFLCFNEDWSAIITQESVAPGWPETIYRRLEDPAFEEWYAQHYKEDKVYAINSTREAADYYIKALEQIDATAYLVAPITKGEQLYGLLIALQLSGPQEWRQSAMDAFHQIAVRINFVFEQREMKEQQEALLREKAALLVQEQRASEALTVIGMSQEDMERQREELQRQQEELLRQKQELKEQGEAARKALVAASLNQKMLREQRAVLLKQRSALLKQRKDLLERLNRGEDGTEKDNNVLEKLKQLWPSR